MDPYEELADAIVLQAVKDYREALKKLKHRPKNKKGLEVREDCESFFRSRLFGRLTALDPEYLMNRIQSEVNET